MWSAIKFEASVSFYCVLLVCVCPSLFNFQNSFSKALVCSSSASCVANQYNTKFPPSKTPDVLTWSNSIEDNEQKDQDNAEVMHPEKSMLEVRNQRYQTITHTTE